MDRKSVKKRLATLDKPSLVALATEFGVTGKKSKSQIIKNLLDLRYGQNGSGLDELHPIVWKYADWMLLQSRHDPAKFFYVDTITGKTSLKLPKELVKMTDGWIKFGKNDFFNEYTQATRTEPPIGAKFVADTTGGKFQFSPTCLKGYEIKQVLGSGGFGQVSTGCLTDDCTYAVKIQRITMPQEFAKEVELSEIASHNGIGPKFYGAWTCENGKIGVIVTEKWDASLQNYLPKRVKKSIVDKYQQLIDQLHRLGYVHLDLQPKNVLVKLDKKGDIVDIALTDFGLAESANTLLSSDDEERYFVYHKTGKMTGDFFNDKKITLKDVRQNNYDLLDKGLLYHLRKTQI